MMGDGGKILRCAQNDKRGAQNDNGGARSGGRKDSSLRSE